MYENAKVVVESETVFHRCAAADRFDKRFLSAPLMPPLLMALSGVSPKFRGVGKPPPRNEFLRYST